MWQDLPHQEKIIGILIFYTGFENDIFACIHRSVKRLIIRSAATDTVSFDLKLYFELEGTVCRPHGTLSPSIYNTLLNPIIT